MSIVEIFNKNMLFVFITLYFLFLFPYFISNNIPLQFDLNIIIVFLVLFVLIFLFLICLYIYAGFIERIFKLYYKTNTNDMFELLDFIIAFIGLFILPASIGILFEINHKFMYLIVFLFFVIYGIIGFLSIKKGMKSVIYINTIVTLLLLLYFLISDIGSVLYLLFIFWLVLFLFITLLNQESCKFNHYIKQNNMHIFFEHKKFIESIKSKFILDNLKKINIYFFIIIILVIFQFLDKIMKFNLYDNVTKNTLLLTKVGSYNTGLVLSSHLSKFLDDSKNVSDKEMFELQTLVIWQNDSYIFIKDNNRSISINREFVALDKFK